MKPTFLPFLLFTVTVLFLNGCKPNAYVPNTINAPMMTEKNDFVGEIGIGTSGLNIQTAYSPLKHFGIMANLNSESIYSKNEKKKYRKANFGEIGLGYYNTIGKKFMWDIYGGGGLGRSFILLDSADRENKTDVDFYRVFAQPSIAYTSKIFKIGLSCRMGYYEAYNVKGDSTTSGYKTAMFLCEPALTIKIGYKWIMGYLQYALSLPLAETNIEYYRTYYGAVTAGVSLKFNFSKKDKNKSK